VDRYYPYTLKRFHKEILDNPELHTIEGRSKEKIQIDVAVQLLLRLNQMHAAGIHHRDIKPANILIQLDHKGFPQVRIIDFGVAMDSSNVVMTDHDARGAPLYWDPAYVRAFRDAALVGERVQQLDYGLQADLWALGLTLWEWSSGKNLRSPKTVFPIAFIETYEQLQSTLGVDWDMEKVQDPTQLASVIYQMLNPDVKQRKKFNTQSALDQVIQIQKFQNSLEDPGFAFSGVF
jgi:serine/threonine protein kinase